MSTFANSLRPSDALSFTLVPGDIRWLRRCLLVLFFIALPLSKVVRVGGKDINFSLADLLLPLIAVLFLTFSVQGSLRLPFLPICLANCALVLASTLLNFDYGVAARGFTSNMVEVVKWLILWVYFYAAVNLLQDQNDFRSALSSWVAASGFVAALGAGGSLYFQFTGIHNPYSLHFRAQGTFEDSNLFATYCSCSLMLALLYRHLVGFRASWVWPVIALHVCGIVLSASRGALLSLIIGVGFLVLFFTSTSFKIAVGSFGGILLLLALASPAQKQILESNPITARLATATVNVNNPEAHERRDLWLAAIDTWKNNPFFGIGRGNHGPLLPGRTLGIPAAHNTYLGVLAELGIFGFLSLACLVLAVVIPIALPSEGKDTYASALLLTSLLFFGLNGMTLNLENCRALWVLLAVMHFFHREQSRILALKAS
jgi:O-antigen ligase